MIMCLWVRFYGRGNFCTVFNWWRLVWELRNGSVIIILSTVCLFFHLSLHICDHSEMCIICLYVLENYNYMSCWFYLAHLNSVSFQFGCNLLVRMPCCLATNHSFYTKNYFFSAVIRRDICIVEDIDIGFNAMQSFYCVRSSRAWSNSST